MLNSMPPNNKAIPRSAVLIGASHVEEITDTGWRSRKGSEVSFLYAVTITSDDGVLRSLGYAWSRVR
jgi:hypothetical protein